MDSRAKHFADAFAASVLGSAAYDGLKYAWQAHSGRDIENIRVFQRAMIIVVESGSIAPDIADAYLQRVASLPSSRRKEYVHKILQPPSREPDARQTAVVIRDHALMTDAAWRSIVAILGVNEPTAAEEWDTWSRTQAAEMNAETDKMLAALRHRENSGPFMRLWYGFTRAFKFFP